MSVIVRWWQSSGEVVAEQMINSRSEENEGISSDAFGGNLQGEEKQQITSPPSPPLPLKVGDRVRYSGADKACQRQ